MISRISPPGREGYRLLLHADDGARVAGERSLRLQALVAGRRGRLALIGAGARVLARLRGHRAADVTAAPAPVELLADRCLHALVIVRVRVGLAVGDHL